MCTNTFLRKYNSDKLIKIVLADTQSLTRKGIQGILQSQQNIQIAGMPESADELQTCLAKDYDVLIIDPFMHQEFDLSAVRDLTAFHNVVVVTSQFHHQEIEAAIDFGVKIYLSKDCTSDELLQAVRAACKKQRFFCRKTILTLYGEYPAEIDPANTPALTSREREIINLIALGMPDREIAQELFLSFHTIRTHRKNIARKIGFTLKNAAQLIWLISSLNDII